VARDAEFRERYAKARQFAHEMLYDELEEAIVRSAGSPHAAYAARRQIMRSAPKKTGSCQWIDGPIYSAPWQRRTSVPDEPAALRGSGDATPLSRRARHEFKNINYRLRALIPWLVAHGRSANCSLTSLWAENLGL
jgi:hypothetical protein